MTELHTAVREFLNQHAEAPKMVVVDYLEASTGASRKAIGEAYDEVTTPSAPPTKKKTKSKKRKLHKSASPLPPMSTRLTFSVVSLPRTTARRSIMVTRAAQDSNVSKEDLIHAVRGMPESSATATRVMAEFVLESLRKMEDKEYPDVEARREALWNRTMVKLNRLKNVKCRTEGCTSTASYEDHVERVFGFTGMSKRSRCRECLREAARKR